MNSLSELVSDVVLRISDFDLGLLGLPSTEFILSVAEGLRTGLTRSKERDRRSLSPPLLVSRSPGLLISWFPCLLVWLSGSSSSLRAPLPRTLDPLSSTLHAAPPPRRIGLRSNRQGFAFSIQDLKAIVMDIIVAPLD
jgi:hypothetical protein